MHSSQTLSSVPESEPVEREGVGNRGMEEGSACENPKGWITLQEQPIPSNRLQRGVMTPLSLTLGQTDTPAIFHTFPELPGVFHGGQC